MDSKSLVILCLVAFCTNIQGFEVHPETKIVGGTAAKEGEFPYQAFIQIPTALGVCAGTVLDSRHIVTAAHCTGDFTTYRLFAPSEVRVRVGSINATSGGLLRHVLRIFRHPNFLLQNFMENDIAVLRLELALPISTTPPPTPPCISPGHCPATPPYIAPLPLPPYNQYIPQGNCTVAGWGSTVNFGNPSSPILMKATSPIQPDSVCGGYFKPGQQICTNAALNRGMGICAGDSGTALVCKGPNGTDFMAGIGSWFATIGALRVEDVTCTTHPAVYTNIAYYLDWVRQAPTFN